MIRIRISPERIRGSGSEAVSRWNGSATMVVSSVIGLLAFTCILFLRIKKNWIWIFSSWFQKKARDLPESLKPYEPQVGNGRLLSISQTVWCTKFALPTFRIFCQFRFRQIATKRQERLLFLRLLVFLPPFRGIYMNLKVWRWAKCKIFTPGSFLPFFDIS